MEDNLRCIVLIVAGIVDRNRAGERLYPCFTPDVDTNTALAFSMPNLILIISG